MIQIIDGRATGKTSRLLLLAKETGCTIACRNPEDLRQKAYQYGITGIAIISYRDLLKRGYGQFEPQELLKGGYGQFDSQEILIDELEMFASYVVSEFHRKLAGYTLSKETVK